MLRLLALALALAAFQAEAVAMSRSDGSVAATAAAAAGVTARPKPAILFTRNPLCIQQYCINPLVPGLGSESGRNVMDEYSNVSFTCAKTPGAWRGSGFCSQLLSRYDFAVPTPPPGAEGKTEKDVIVEQGKKAIATYAAHLSGMGRDFWQHTEPWDQDVCIQSIWKLACFLHFPSCSKEAPSTYLRPCSSSCQDYLSSCGVECCDESAQCVFVHEKRMAGGDMVTEEGFSAHKGPSPYCTGDTARTSDAARARAALPLLLLLAGAVGLIANL